MTVVLSRCCLLVHIHFKKNLKTLLATPASLAGSRGRSWGPSIRLTSLEAVFINGPSGVLPPLLVLLLLWVVEEPPGPRCRAGLGLVVLDFRLGRGVVVFGFRCVGGTVISCPSWPGKWSSWLPGWLKEGSSLLPCWGGDWASLTSGWLGDWQTYWFSARGLNLSSCEKTACLESGEGFLELQDLWGRLGGGATEGLIQFMFENSVLKLKSISLIFSSLSRRMFPGFSSCA